MTLATRALELLCIPSVITEERAIADFIEAWASQHFAPTEVLRVSHSFVIGKRADPRPTIALVGHLDTVPAHPDPNPPRIEGDRLFGLGASDMKGALAVMLRLGETLARPALPFNVLWVLYEREEGPFQESGLGPLFAQVPELRQVALAIAMEPTDGVVQVGCVGTLHATLTLHGRSAHSARPWQGVNAIHAAGSVLTDLTALDRREVRLGAHTFYEVLSATLAHGGRARNVVPDTCTLNLNYRFAPGKSLEQAQREVTDFVRGRGALQFIDLAPSGRVCDDNPHYRRLVELTRRAPEAKQAWTDVARFSELGVDAVNFGPGETAQAHQRTESASVAALSTSFEQLTRLLTGAA